MCNNFVLHKRIDKTTSSQWKVDENGQKCPKITKWSYGNNKFSVANKAGRINFTLSNVCKAVLHNWPADPGHKNQPFKRYSRFSSKFLIFLRFWTRFSRISQHAQISRKSDPLQNLITHRYGAACQFLGKSYGKFLKYPIFGGYFVYVFSGAAPGPSPSLKVDLLREKANAHLERMTVWHYVFCDIFDERRAAPPAYGRRAWSKVISYLRVFRSVFRYWSEFRRRPKNKTILAFEKLVKNKLGQLRNSLFDFEAL